MKLKNKKTGEIGELQITEKHCAVAVGNGTASCGIEIYSSLAELNEDWEDYEEPKEYWRIDCDGTISQGRNEFDTPFDNMCKEIGNYFETKEEAEQAVRKLKAWKRLKDNGFKFDEWERDKEFSGDYIIKASDYHTCDNNDLDLLFGGEE